VKGKPLVYLDTAATAQKPFAVIEAVRDSMAVTNANVRRAVHTLSSEATRKHEAARATVARFLGSEPGEIVFTKGCTEAINLVAATFIRPGDKVVLTEMEHHSNIVPWQLAGAKIEVVPMKDDFTLDMDALAEKVEEAKLVAFGHISNAVGTVHPVAEMAQVAHAAGAAVLVDGAQSAPAMPVDVRALDADFYTFSGHKAYGPTGIGVLYGKASILAGLPPYQGGGDMIDTVTFEQTTFAAVPHRFEAGTPPIAQAAGLAVALEFLESLGRDQIFAHETGLATIARAELSNLDGVTVLGPSRSAGIVSFTVDGVHPHDVATLLDQQGVAVRAGHHCCQPLMRRLGVSATTRASFGIYSTESDVDALVAGVKRVQEVFA
jgi:cysteine desulfurase/selenocysteine lyase